MVFVSKKKTGVVNLLKNSELIINLLKTELICVIFKELKPLLKVISRFGQWKNSAPQLEIHGKRRIFQKLHHKETGILGEKAQILHEKQNHLKPDGFPTSAVATEVGLESPGMTRGRLKVDYHLAMQLDIEVEQTDVLAAGNFKAARIE